MVLVHTHGSSLLCLLGFLAGLAKCAVLLPPFLVGMSVTAVPVPVLSAVSVSMALPAVPNQNPSVAGQVFTPGNGQTASPVAAATSPANVGIVGASPQPALQSLFYGVNVAFPTPSVPVQSLLASISNDVNRQMGNMLSAAPSLPTVGAASLPALSLIPTAVNGFNSALPSLIPTTLNGINSALPSLVIDTQSLASSVLNIGTPLAAAATALPQPGLTNIVNNVNSILGTPCFDILGYVVSQADQLPSTLLTLRNTCQPSGALATSSLPLTAQNGGSQTAPAAVSVTTLASLNSIGSVSGSFKNASLSSAAASSPSSTCTSIDPAQTDTPAAVDQSTGLLFRASCGISNTTVLQCPYLCGQAGGGAFKQCSNNDLSGQQPTGQFPPILCTRCLPPCASAANTTVLAPSQSEFSRGSSNNSSSTLAPLMSSTAGSSAIGATSPSTSMSATNSSPLEIAAEGYWCPATVILLLPCNISYQ